MFKFATEEGLGPTVTEVKCWCFGVEPIDMWQLRFAGGGNKFSQLCGFRFRSAMTNNQYRDFSISFVAKLRSKIYRQAAKNPSQWYVFKHVSPTQVDVLGKKELLVNYGFDVDKFMECDMFKKMLSQFKKTIKQSVEVSVPKFISTIKNKDDASDARRFQASIIEGFKLLDSKLVNNKFYTLNDLDAFIVKEQDTLDCKINEQFKKTGIYVDLGDELEDMPSPEGLVDEKESSEKDIVSEASCWDCEVKKETEDGEEVWKVYEKNDHFWVATCHDEASAIALAEEYPKLKEQYLKQSNEDDCSIETTESEQSMKKRITESDGEWSIYARTLRSYDGYHFYADVHPNHFYTQDAAQEWVKTFEDEISDALQYWYGQTVDRHELYVARASDIKNPRLISFSDAEFDPKYKKAWKEYQDELADPKYGKGRGDDSGLRAYDAAMKQNKKKIEQIYSTDKIKSESECTKNSAVEEKEQMNEAGYDERIAYENAALSYGEEVFAKMQSTRTSKFDRTNAEQAMAWAMFGCAEWLVKNSKLEIFKELGKKISQIGSGYMI